MTLVYVPAHGEEIIKRIKKEIDHLAKSKTETKMKYKKFELKYTSKGEHQFNQPSIPICKIGWDKKVTTLSSVSCSLGQHGKAEDPNPAMVHVDPLLAEAAAAAAVAAACDLH